MLDKVFQFSNGVRVLNCTKHALNFQDGDQIIVVESSGFLVDANISEEVYPRLCELYKVEIVSPSYHQTDNTILRMDELRKQFVAAKIAPILFIGSQIAAMAYPGRIAALIPIAGFERVPWDQERMRIDKFTMF